MLRILQIINFVDPLVGDGTIQVIPIHAPCYCSIVYFWLHVGSGRHTGAVLDRRCQGHVVAARIGMVQVGRECAVQLANFSAGKYGKQDGCELAMSSVVTSTATLKLDFTVELNVLEPRPKEGSNCRLSHCSRENVFRW